MFQCIRDVGVIRSFCRLHRRAEIPILDSARILLYVFLETLVVVEGALHIFTWRLYAVCFEDIRLLANVLSFFLRGVHCDNVAPIRHRGRAVRN